MKPAYVCSTGSFIGTYFTCSDYAAPEVRYHGADGAGHGEAYRKMEHGGNQFIVNVFTNGSDPEGERQDAQDDMAYIEFCREMFRLRQNLSNGVSSKEENK